MTVLPTDLTTLLLLILPGAVGGIVRGLVGISKNLSTNGGTIRPMRLLFSVLVALIAGAVAGVLTENNWQVALLAGYAGSDLLEGMYKTKMLGLLK